MNRKEKRMNKFKSLNTDFRTVYPKELPDRKCGECVRCELRNHSYNGKQEGYHCTMQPYDKDIQPGDKACVHWGSRKEEMERKRLYKEAEENRRKKLWATYSIRKPVKLPIVNDGFGEIPECPICGEMPYSTEQCHWCGQRFILDEEVENYLKPLTKKMKCFSCDADVVAKVSRYNGHIHYRCEKCGCRVMS